jgi:predicted nucleic acid-binding protein
MIRVVFDTNVLISRSLQARGVPAHVLLVTISGTAARPSVSGEVYAEYEEVIRRPRFKRTENPPTKCEPAPIRTTMFFSSARRRPAPTIL